MSITQYAGLENIQLDLSCDRHNFLNPGKSQHTHPSYMITALDEKAVKHILFATSAVFSNLFLARWQRFWLVISKTTFTQPSYKLPNDKKFMDFVESYGGKGRFTRLMLRLRRKGIILV